MATRRHPQQQRRSNSRHAFARRLLLEPLEDRRMLAGNPNPPAFATANPNFPGQTGGGTPPDTIGDVGLNHYIQMVNTTYQIYDKLGNSLFGPVAINTPWVTNNVGTICQNNNNGDPYVIYDHLADRWVISQFAVPNGTQGNPTGFCVAVSRTADPVNGTDAIPNNGNEWFAYEYLFDNVANPRVDFDYPKLSLWHDAYYMSSQRGFPGDSLDVWAFDRANMLIGNPGAFVTRNIPQPALVVLPSDLDGVPAPPGTPAFFTRHRDFDLWGGCPGVGADCVEIFAFSVDWTNPAASTLTQLPSIATDPFDSGLLNPGNLFDTSIPQPSVAIPNLDSIPNWPMGPLQYRNFGTYESLVFNHTVDVDGNAHAGVKWYELRRAPGGAWGIFQEGTYSPDLGNPGLADDVHRWMGSVAMDKNGNIAVGYSASSATVNPDIRYAGRLAADPLGTLPHGENVMQGGTSPVVLNFCGPLNNQPCTRWGDYSGMRVDPADDCTFWYTQEFGQGNTWATQIGAFKFPSCAYPADKFEENDTIATATVLGSLPKITLRDLTIDSDGDVDFFQYTAQDTGKLIVNIFFDNADGNLDLRVRDSANNIIATGVFSNIVQGSDRETLVIPVVTQERYYIEVFSAAGHTNEYDLELENFAAPVPIAIDLRAEDDSGRSDSDNVTNEDQGQITILADLSEFAAEGIDILTPDEVDDDEPGAAVEVYVRGVFQGTATPVAGSDSTLFSFTFGAGDLVEGLNFVTAAVRIYDDKTPQADGRTQLSEPLLLTLDTLAPAQPSIDLLAASDSGTSDSDNVTKVAAPAFSNIAATERNLIVRVRADGVTVGEGVSSSAGAWEITVEPLRDNVYDMTVEVEDLAGNVSDLSGALEMEIDTLAPNTPHLDLVESSDSGRHNDDNITNDNTPDMSATTDDPVATNGAAHMFDSNFIFRIYDRLENSDEALIYLTTITSLTQVTPTLLALDDGIHNLKLEVEDRAGNISHDFLLDVLIDTVAPTGTVNLFPDSDSGIWGFPETMHDGVTSNMTPLLYGAAEANALVRIALDIDENPPGGIPDGTAVALPYDGDDAFPPPPEFDGNYFLQTIHSLMDGEHTLTAFFQDVAGNETPADEAPELTIFIDTTGPQITNVTRGLVSVDNEPDFDGVHSVFEPKPSDSGPDPLVHSIVIHFRDLPLREGEFADLEALFGPLAEEEGNYSLKGDHNGYIAIVDVIVNFDFESTDDPEEFLATATAELVFDQPLPDDRYTLFVSDSISDVAGNPLDGESGAVGPFEGNDVPDETPPIFPTGDGEHGGSFFGRFTIDSRPEIGTYALGSMYIDINGNAVWDPEGQDNDYTNRDIAFVFGYRDDRIFAGNFNPAGAGAASGYDKLGGYGTAGQGSAWRWRLDFDHDGVVDYDVASGVTTQGDPVAGNFSAGHDGDEIGLFNAGKWWLDAEGDNNIGGPGDIFLQGNMRGQPIVGDFDGDGFDDLATWDPGNAGTQFDGVFQFDLAFNGLTGNTEATIQFDIPGVFQKAVAADMNGDGIDDIGLFVSRREGVPPSEAAEWFFLISDTALESHGTVNALNHPFTPVPFGNDLFAQFGDEAALPVVGNFDPPSGPVGNTGSQNPLNPLDVNNDGRVSVFDAALVVNHINANGVTSVASSIPQAPFLDVSHDSRVSIHDAALIVNHLNAAASVAAQSSTSAEGEADPGSDGGDTVDSELLAILADDQESLRRRRG